MRSTLATLSVTLLTATLAAQGTAWYIPDNVATVGTCNVIPFGNIASSATWANQRYQTIVTTADLGGLPGLVTGIGFAPCGTGTHQTQRLTITLAHVPSGFTFAGNNNFDNNLLVLGTGATVVLDQANYEWEKTANAWSSVGLDNSFVYNGTDDLLIDIIAVGNNSTNGDGGMHRDVRPRLYSTSWTGTPPATGSVGQAAAKIQIQMGCADVTTFGHGCGGLQLAFSGSAVLGQTLNVDASGGGPGLPISLNIGMRNDFPFPIDLSSIGLRGCFMLCDSIASVNVTTDALGNATVPLAIPANLSAYGVRLFHQFVHVNPSLPNLFALSNGGRSVLGPQCP